MDTLVVFLAVFFGLSIIFKVPMGFGMGIGALVTFLYFRAPLSTYSGAAFSALESPALLAIPFFIIAGLLMERSSISEQLLRFFNSIVSRVRGSAGMLTIVVSAAFGLLTGSALATISAIGKMVTPNMTKHNYPKGYQAALLAATSFLGMMIPPSIPGIIYAQIDRSVKVMDVWMCTVGPGLCLMLLYGLYNYWYIGCKEPKAVDKFGPFEPVPYAKNIAKSFIKSLPALGMPVIIFGGIYGGVFTPTEAGCISALYGFVFFLVLKKIKKVPEMQDITSYAIFRDSGVMVAVICAFMIFSATAGRVLTYAGVGDALAKMVTSRISSPIVFMLLVNLLFLFMGTFMDNNSIILIMVPLFLPTIRAYGIEPLQFAALTLLNTSIGLITPPLAGCLYLGARIADADIADTIKEIVPFVGIGVVVLLIITFFPGVSTFMPGLFH